jgi:ArsR family transcriptional regulator
LDCRGRDADPAAGSDREAGMSNFPQPIFHIQAALCQAMGHEIRQEIVHLLRAGPMRVSDIAEALHHSQSTVSRHLSTLRKAEILITRRAGTDVIYSIANPKMLEVCDLMREVLMEQLQLHSRLLDEQEAPDVR